MYLDNIQISDTKSVLEMGMWLRFYQSNSSKTRNELIEYYLPLVKQIAGFIFYKRTVSEVAYEDYYQFGVLGLIESIDRYQMDGRALFSTYATYRIKGAIYSGLATITEKRAQSECRKKLVQDRLNSVNLDSNTLPDFEEMVNLTIGLALGYLVIGSYNDGDTSFTTDDLPYKAKELAELTSNIRTFIETLPQKEYIVVKYHYFNSVNFDDIADILGITKGRVSQLHKAALDKLRKKLRTGVNVDCIY